LPRQQGHRPTRVIDDHHEPAQQVAADHVRDRRPVRDLLGLDAIDDPTVDFPADERANVFDDNAALQAVTSLRLQGYLEAGEGLATALLAQRPPRVISCWPTTAAEEGPCARQILSALVSRAYRRPPTPDEVDAVISLYQSRASDGFSSALATAVTGVLVAPQFLFRSLGPAPGTSARALRDHELASRLSYFLWRTMPDDELRAHADAGDLGRGAELDRQIARMLQDGRSSALVEVLAEQWLGLRGLEGTAPDRALYAAFYEQSLAASMRAETHAFLASLLAEPVPFGTALTAPYTYADDKLAALYGLPTTTSALTRVDLSATDRRGLLGQASVLALNANADRTSIVKRGKWILSVLLCMTLPDPPANVVQQLAPSGAARGQRAELAAHRQSSDCSACHGQLDPPGLALEGFDLLGRSRTTDEEGFPVDTHGTLADGRAFSGAADLGVLVRDDPRFGACLARNLLTFALGRELNEGDACVAGVVAAHAPASSRTLAELVRAVVANPSFLTQPGEEL